MKEVDITNELDGADFNDLRLNKRATKTLRLFFEGISNSIPSSCKGRTETEGAYRFFGNSSVSPQKMLLPHLESTLERIKQYKVVLLIQDSTDINAKHLEKVEGLGVLNDAKKPGCVAHTMIACTPDRLCLGVVNNEYIIRNEIGNKSPNNSRPIEEKESYKWIKAYQKSLEIAEKCSDTHFINIGDREADLIELFAEAKSVGNKVDIVIRAFQDRSVEVEESDKKIKTRLKKAVSSTQSLGKIEFRLPGRNGKKGRIVEQTLKATTVTIHPPKHKKHLGAVDINVVFLEEVNPPENEPPICWTLLTTLPISTRSEIDQVVQLYLSRWSIEVFFHILKTGCRIEKLQFGTAHSFLNCVTLYMIVAWRLYYIVFLGRNCPTLPCTVIFEGDEWRSVYAIVQKAKPPDEPPELGEMVNMIAKLGGFLGRKCDGFPGPRVMWSGLQKMTECAKGWAAYRNFG